MNELIKRVCADIITLMNSSLSEQFVEAVLNRLVSFGYCLKEDDSWAICFAIQKVENHIKNSCNVTSIPDGLFHIAVDKVCGEYLLAKKQTGKLNIWICRAVQSHRFQKVTQLFSLLQVHLMKINSIHW